MNRVREVLQCDSAEVDGSGVRIAVLDTGIDLTHLDFKGRVNEGASATFCQGANLEDRHGHGTHVAGIIAGTGAASGGLYRGIAPGAELIILNTPLALIKPDVVVPGGDQTPIERQQHPLANLGLLTNGTVSARSSTGKLLGLDPSDPDDRYTRIPGTSQATAVVSGLAALLLQLGRMHGADWGPNQAVALRQLIRISAIRLQVGDWKDYGHGALWWPNLKANLSDYIANPSFRQIVLCGRQLQLVP